MKTLHQASMLSIAITALAPVAPAGAQVQFVEMSTPRGMQPYVTAHGKGGGVAAADFDGDGDIDLFVPTAEGSPDQLYRNLGDGHFEEIAGAAGVASMKGSRVALWFDYDGDDRLDLFVAGDCWAGFGSFPDEQCPNSSTLRLFRQVAEAQFTDVTLTAGIPDDQIDSSSPHRGGLAAGDLDGDGWLDLVVCIWQGEMRILFNDGDGTFSDAGASSGIGQVPSYYWQPVLHDFNADGRLDLYVAIDFIGNQLWMNQGDGTFLDAAPTIQANNAWNDMGVTLGDYDNDGDFDLYITNITQAHQHNVLFRNDSIPTAMVLNEVSLAAGVSQGGWGWVLTFFDADNDGDLDLAETNGWFAGLGDLDESHFFRNDGGAPVVFTDVSASVGFDDNLWGSTVIALDHDRDGDLDLVQTCNSSGSMGGAIRILDNEPEAAAAANHFLVVRPRMVGPNRRAIGAVLRATAGGVSMSRLITAGTSHLGQEPAEAFFGLGAATQIDELVIEWPDGRVTEHGPIPADQAVTLTIGGVTLTDVTPTAGIGQPSTLNESCAWGDYDNDGDEDLYLTNNNANRLYRNDGGDVFTDVTSATGTGNALFSVGTAFGDLDNDGDLDLYVVNFGLGPDALYRNDGPVGPGGEYQFTDIAAAAGITIERSSRGMRHVDFDRDGLLDIYVNSIGNDLLYHNQGGLTFIDVANTMGTMNIPSGQGVGVVATDLDENGWIDLYNGNRSSDLSNVFMNSFGFYTDINPFAGLTVIGLGMGVHAFDYDNDLDMDLYWTTWPGAGPTLNALYENQGDNTYVDVAAATGTTDAPGWGISNNIGDIDNDRWMDFFVTNGFDETSGPNILFRNVGGTTFEDVAALHTLLDDTTSNYDGRGVAFADYDNDGDIDFVLTGDLDDETRLVRNDSITGHHWVTFRLTGTMSNRSAIRARVEVTAGGTTTVNEVSGGAGRGSFNSLPVEFGLGTDDTITETFIRWPSGRHHHPGPLAVDQFHAITEPDAADTDADGDKDIDDIVNVVLAWGGNGKGTPGIDADVNQDGVVGIDDLVAVVVAFGS